MTLLLLALVQGRWQIVPLRPLKGVYVAAERPALTLRGVADGSWQQQTDKYLKEHFGFREPAIRLYNQYVWSCYGKTMNDAIVAPGREGYLYEGYFVADHYQGRMYEYTDNPQELLDKFDRETELLAELQRALAERGTVLFVALLPGKDLLYPEYLPPQGRYTRVPGPKAYPEYLRRFKEKGINYVDVMDWFSRIKDSVPYDLMTQQGTHWSNIAATYAFDSIMRYMQGLGGAPITPVRLGTPYYDKTREPDNDLAELMNLLVLPRQRRCQYVDVEYPEGCDTVSGKPGLIVIGDSFFWTVSYNYKFDNLFRYVHYWFYNNSVYFDPEHDNVGQINLVEALEDADYVMLNYCTGQLYELGNGFVEKAVEELRGGEN